MTTVSSYNNLYIYNILQDYNAMKSLRMMATMSDNNVT